MSLIQRNRFVYIKENFFESTKLVFYFLNQRGKTYLELYKHLIYKISLKS